MSMDFWLTPVIHQFRRFRFMIMRSASAERGWQMHLCARVFLNCPPKMRTAECFWLTCSIDITIFRALLLILVGLLQKRPMTACGSCFHNISVKSFGTVLG